MLVVRRTHCIHLLDIYIDVDNINTWVKDLMLSHSFEKKTEQNLDLNKGAHFFMEQGDFPEIQSCMKFISMFAVLVMKFLILIFRK